MRGYKFTRKSDDEVIDALRQTGGIISDAAKILGLVSVTALRVRISKSEKLSAYRTEYLEDLKDRAEKVVADSIKAGNVQTAMWMLKLMAKERGYMESVNLTAKVDMDVKADLSKLSGEELIALEQILQKTNIEETA